MKHIAYIYLLIIAVTSVISVILTVYDKLAAKNRKRRIPEKTLLLTAFSGGATAMFITMCIIRHKTKHMKFMISLPVMSLIHIILAVYLNTA